MLRLACALFLLTTAAYGQMLQGIIAGGSTAPSVAGSTYLLPGTGVVTTTSTTGAVLVPGTGAVNTE